MKLLKVTKCLNWLSAQNPTMSSTPTLFLFFRRGIPLICVTLSLTAILIHPPSAGWALIVAVALLAEVGTTFYAGAPYVAKRRAIARWDGYWLMFLRPFFRFINLEDRWLRSFCAWNNRRVSKTFKTKRVGKAIVLLPHCVQLVGCQALVVENISSCFGCGQCVVDAAAQAAMNYNWDMRVSPRSRTAYSEARKFRPDIIIAVACPDRLVKGLLKLPEVPSYAIPLDLPHGMCVNTAFDFQRLSQAMNELAETRATAKIQPLKISCR